MRFMVIIKNLFELLKLLWKIPPGDVLFLLKYATEEKPNVVSKTLNGLTIFGLQNDYLFDMALENGVTGNEPHFEAIAPVLIGQNDNCLDIGANIGTHTILLSKISNNGQVFSFEPQSITFSLLQNNLFKNNCDNVTALKYALTSRNNEIISMDAFSFNDDNLNNGACRIELNSNTTKGDLVLTRTIDSFNFPRIKFIKIDIQGAEPECLKGAKSIIKRDKPIIFLEIEEHHLRALGSSSKRLIELMFDLNYVLFRIMTDYPCDHLCIHKDNVSYFEDELMDKIPFQLLKVAGKKIRLHFNSEKSLNFYDSFEITK